MYFFIGFALILANALKWLHLPPPSDVAQLAVYGAVAVIFVAGIAMNRFRDSFFPRAVFVIGQGEIASSIWRESNGA